MKGLIHKASEDLVIHVKRISFEQEKLALRDLRKRAWGNQSTIYWSIPENSDQWSDELDTNPSVLQWGVFLNDQPRPIAACRLSFHDHYTDSSELWIYSELWQEKTSLDNNTPMYGFMSRLVVDPDWRGYGLATMLDRMRLETFIATKVPYLLVNIVGEARARAMQRCGFKVVRAFEVDQLPKNFVPTYCMMAKREDLLHYLQEHQDDQKIQLQMPEVAIRFPQNI